MCPQSFKEELSSGFYYDTLLVGRQNGHLREFIESMEMDSQGRLGVERGVYRRDFFVVDLEMV